MREYQDYLQDCIEYGGDPITQEEFENQLLEERELK